MFSLFRGHSAPLRSKRSNRWALLGIIISLQTAHCANRATIERTVHRALTRGATAPNNSGLPVPESGSLSFNGVAGWTNFTDVFTFKYTPSTIRIPAVSVTTPEGFQDSPLGVFSAQRCRATSWNVPLEAPTALSPACRYRRVVKQICPNLNCQDPGQVSVVLAALTAQHVPYNISVEYVNTTLSYGVDQQVEVAPWMPRFLKIDVGDNEAVDILITSPDSYKAVAAIQTASCPVYDLPSNIRYGSQAQTVSKQAQMYVASPDDGQSLFLVLVLEPSANECDINTTSKFTVRLTPSLPKIDYVEPALKLLALYLAFYFTVILFWAARKLAPYVRRGEPRRRQSATQMSTLAERASTRGGGGGVFNNHRVKWDDGSYSNFDKFFFRSKAVLRVSDLARKVPSLQERKSLRYLWYLIVISIFYFLPVAQLVLGYLDMYHHGDEDKCYFNFRCAHPLGLFRSFNNVYSNVGYVLLGALFIIIVKYRAESKRSSVGDRSIGSEFDRDLGSSTKFTLTADDLGAPDTSTGLPPNHGVFYALGYAIVCEGIFSACYHVCPNSENFQFDSSFMYVIALLLILALHQRRHSDVQSQPQWPYLLVGLFISLEVVGVYWGNPDTAFFAILVIIYVPLSVTATISVYLVAPWRLRWSANNGESVDGGIGLQAARGRRPRQRQTQSAIYEDEFNDADATPLIGMATDRAEGAADEDHFLAVRDQTHFILAPSWRLRELLPLRRDRLALVLVINATNWGLLLYGILARSVDVPSFLLLVLISNFFAYLAHYVVMKLVRKEVITWRPIACMILSTLSWGPALHFFNAGLVSWDEGAANSREGNAPCILWNFYDAHDVWHICSGFAVFFGALMVLTLDDDLVNTPRTKILV